MLTEDNLKDLKIIGNRIKELRLEKKFSQAKLAADCNVEISQISRIERGLLNTGIIQLISIARALEIAPSLIFDTIVNKQTDFF